MYLVLVILIVVVCVLLGGIVLIQNPKGGGLTSNFSSQSQLMGVQKTGDFLEKGTWVLAIALMVLCLAVNVSVKGTGPAKNAIDPATQKAIDKTSKGAIAPTAQPATPITIPAQKKGK
jgi:preprotein translocase subunit SecG